MPIQLNSTFVWTVEGLQEDSAAKDTVFMSVSVLILSVPSTWQLRTAFFWVITQWSGNLPTFQDNLSMVKLPCVGPWISTGLWHHLAQCILALHMVFVPCNSTGLWVPPSYCFVLDYTFINLIPSSLPPTVLMWVFSCLTITQVRIPSAQLHWQPCSPPFNPLHQSYWLTPYYQDICTAHILPYINSILGLQGFFWIPEPWRWDWEVVPKFW